MHFKATKKKSKFTCKAGKCTYNCWVCTLHKVNNKVLLDEIRNIMKAEGLTMGFHVRLKDIGKAFAELRYRYGDEERVLGIRVKELKKLGPMSEKYKDQV